MKVLSVASECVPLVKTGGLADVVGALPAALAAQDVQTRVLLPAYRPIRHLLDSGVDVAGWDDLPGGPARIVACSHAGLDLLLLDAPQLFDRAGTLYLDESGSDWPDNHLRFGALSMAAARIGVLGAGGWAPDVIHAHDWQAGLVPVYLRQDEHAHPPTVLTIHNIAFQGRYGPQLLGELGLKQDWFHPEALEFHGDLSFLKAGLALADRIATVSPTYAREILTPHFGMGLDGLLRARSAVVSGIMNGIDTDVWNPETDGTLPARFTARTLKRRAGNRAEICTKFNLDPDHSGPLYCVVSRLTEQKGLDALAEALPALVETGGQLAVLGTGDPRIEEAFRHGALHHPGRVGVHIGYDEALSHLLQGGSDAILIPSRFEPSGLTQLYALRYGTIPVVARTGGLADTVIDANLAAISAGVATGLEFADVSAQGIAGVLQRTAGLYRDSAIWQRLQRNAMRQDVSWSRSAKSYAELYQSLR